MHLTKSPKTFAVAAAAAIIAVGLPQAAGQSPSQPHNARSHAWKALALPWVRRALAEAPPGRVRPRIPIGNFKACPRLPAGFSPASFSCFITHITGGELELGKTSQVINRTITIPYAMGVDPSGKTVIVPGITKAEPMPVLGGIFEDPLVGSAVSADPNLRLSIRPVGLGIAVDPTGHSAGFISQKLAAINPVFGRGCAVGSRQHPVTFAPTFGTTSPPPPNQPISGHVDSVATIGHEAVIVGTAVDNAFSAPAAAGCGPSQSLDQVVDAVSGLPSPAGTNTAIFQLTVEIIGYPFI